MRINSNGISFALNEFKFKTSIYIIKPDLRRGTRRELGSKHHGPCFLNLGKYHTFAEGIRREGAVSYILLRFVP